MGKYNTTQLDPMAAAQRGIMHRDFLAHSLRWTHVLYKARIGMKILDVGCGSGNLYEVFYRNRFKPLRFVGVDIRKTAIDKLRGEFKQLGVTWEAMDIVEDALPKDDWDIITSFEVIEHIGKQNGDKFLRNIKNVMTKNTEFMLSTPCFDGKVGAANNHIINGVVGEYTFQELKELLERYFVIKEVFGTFASQKDYKSLMNEWQKNMFNGLNRYYDNNLVSNLIAPFFPEHSRNCLWTLILKP